jgi:uncharacterized protein (DUF1778 family)
MVYYRKEIINMSVSEAQRKAIDKYLAEKTERITLRFPKGKKEVYQQQAAAHGKSLTQYIIDLLEADK